MFSFLYHCQDFYRTWLYIWVTRRVSSKKQELLTLLVHPRIFGGVSVAHLFNFLCCPIMCLYVLSSVLWCPLRFPPKTMFNSSVKTMAYSSKAYDFLSDFDLCSCCFIIIFICIVLSTTLLFMYFGRLLTVSDSQLVIFNFFLIWNFYH